MTDVVLKAIREKKLSNENVSFSRIRALAARDYSIKDQLNRGRAVLHNTNQLDQYLFTYGRMIESQWEFALKKYTVPNIKPQIIDYACGQGLGSMFLIESLLNTNAENFQRIILIDPSSVALNRAVGTLDCYQTGAQLIPINKFFEETSAGDIQTDSRLDTLHVFSNILDINDFNLQHLTDIVASTTGKHHFIALSNDRDVHGGLHRVLDFPDALRKKTTDFKSEWEKFECKNGMSAVFLQGQFSVQ